MDTRTPEQRRRIMRAVKGVDTKPEWIVRRTVFRLGYRYRLHRRDLPGTPDLVFFARRKIIFVNGCFWHWHGCAKGRLPKSRLTFWQRKLERNRARDAENLRRLEGDGWKVMVVWQCETADVRTLQNRLVDFLET